MSRAITAVLLVAFAASSSAAETRADRQRTRRILAVGGALVVYATSEIVLKSAFTPENCTWCSVPGIDASMRSHLRWSDPELARDLSNLTGYVLAPLGTGGLLLLASRHVADEGRWMTFTDDLIAVFEAAAYSQFFVQAVKFSFGRQRPYVHYATEPLPYENDHNVSFFSGHSTLTFSIAVAAGSVATRRGYSLAPVIWGTSLALAATTAYLRVAGDRHYFTDVLTGSVFGAAAGIVIPRLTGSLPDRITVAPTTNGLQVVGSF
ncbi:MAG: phosphatase PAP2 family protein [Deltaproteobacteria bacterium]|nr:phosphatase PAP2 family protein [Deltaproteobacteria bacterium]